MRCLHGLTLKNNVFITFICDVGGGRTHAMVCLWRSEGNLWESVLLMLCGFWGLNSGCPVWLKALYPLSLLYFYDCPFFSTVKALDGKLQVSTPRVGKVFGAPGLPKASRKALGTVNRVTEKPVKSSKPLQSKQPTLSVKKVSVGCEHLHMCWRFIKKKFILCFVYVSAYKQTTCVQAPKEAGRRRWVLWQWSCSRCELPYVGARN